MLIADVTGAYPSTGWVSGVIAQVAEMLDGATTAVKTQLKDSPVLHVDETSVNIAGAKWWLHVACTQKLTAYHLHRSRGRVAVDEFAVLPGYTGTAVHDALSVYDGDKYATARHAWCGAHIGRELIAAADADPDAAWCKAAIEAFHGLNNAAHQARDNGQASIPATIAEPLQHKWNHAVLCGLAGNPRRPGREQSKTRNLLERLRDHHGKVAVLAACPEVHGRVEEDLRALQRLEPPGEQRDPRALETEAAAQAGAVVLSEETGIDARLGDADPISRSAIQPDEVLCLRRARGHEPVCLGSQLTLRLGTERVERQTRARLGQGQGVKRLHPRHVPRVTKAPADEATVPVVAVDGTVGPTLGCGVPDGGVAELVEQRADVLLADGLRRPHGEPNQPAQGRDQFLVRTRSVAAHEHVGRNAPERESLAQPANREVHAAVLAAAQIRQRGRVHGDDGDRA